MIKKIVKSVSSLLATRLSRQVRELYISTVILNLAVSLINIFEPVFIFNLFYSKIGLKGALEAVLFFYLVVYVVYFFAIPGGVRFAKKYGYENSMAVSSVFQVLFYFLLFISGRYLLFLPLAVLPYVFAKMFYWPAYHANFARFSLEEEQGREISNLWAISSLATIIAPLLGGFIIEFFGFKILFFIASLLILFSNLPMLVTKEIFEPSDFSLINAFKNLFNQEKRRDFWSIFAFGEEFIVLVLWPIFMFLTISNFLGLGIISAVSILISTVVLLLVGNLTDKNDPKPLFVFGVISYLFSWLIRILARNSLGVLVVDAYSRVSKNISSVPLMAKLYKQAHNGSVMSTIAFFEMSLVIGKITAIIICLLLLQIFAPGWNAIFIAGAIYTLFYLLFKIK